MFCAACDDVGPVGADGEWEDHVLLKGKLAGCTLSNGMNGGSECPCDFLEEGIHIPFPVVRWKWVLHMDHVSHGEMDPFHDAIHLRILNAGWLWLNIVATK